MIRTSKYCCEMEGIEDEIKIFIAGAKKIAEMKGFTQEDIFKGVKWPIGLKGSQGTISSYFVGRTRPKKAIRLAIADFFGVNYEDILSIGRQSADKPIHNDDHIRKVVREEMNQAPASNISLFNDARNKEHHETINKFQDQETALRINQKLVLAESIDPKILKKIEKIIDIEIDAAPSKPDLSRHQGNGTLGE